MSVAARGALACALLLAATAASAAEPSAPQGRGPLDAAWRSATAMAHHSLGEEGAGRLTLLAYVSVVGRSCEGLDVNGARFKGAFRELAEDRKGELGDAKKTRSALRRVSYHLGVATGIFLSEHALDGARFCAGARDSIAADPVIAAFFAPEAAAPAARTE
jgi:hypothetical protein